MQFTRLSERLGASVSGIDLKLEHGRALLRELFDWTTRDRFIIRLEWSNGDIVVWDNRGAMHRAVPYEYTQHRRVLRRREVSSLAA